MKHPNSQGDARVTYTVRAETVEGCDCEDCRAGRHIYSLFRWRDNTWKWVGTSLQSYHSVEETKTKHLWCIDFEPGAVWEDGTPVVEPEPTNNSHQDQGGTVEWVPLDMSALQKSCETMLRHWLPKE